MKTGLGRGALLLSLAVVGGMGCKTQPYCASLAACGGDLLKGQTDKVNMDGLADREWSVTKAAACEDQLETPPTPLALVRQPPVPANVRPPDNVTADWCSNIAFNPDGTVSQFFVWAPPIPLKVGNLVMSQDSDTNDPDSLYRGTYKMQITFEQPFSFAISETCLTTQGFRESCPTLGRQIGAKLASEANIYEVRCYNPDDPNQGGCQCDYDLTFIGGPRGRWYTGQNSTTINFFDEGLTPPVTADYCLGSSGSLDLTGHDGASLFNEKSMRTLTFSPPSCHDGVQSLSLGETGIDCGGSCGNTCGTCSDGIKNGDEDGIDCGGSCIGALCTSGGSGVHSCLCDPSPSDPNHILAACKDGKQEKWEEGVDCGGPCGNVCP
jgi:hypothetical protein